ncbi:hypothetical protein RND81_01G119100 [Saponaria officinalis]|uniref:6,7-dimethyl-8-ribityllumazine synthase n=1 Tax=Saponaria officinalis TaxID=3572 RepID=A0AAW1NDB8_SAPOF
MGNSLRCCLACVLPCGALDVIRIVHLNGFVEEITRSITAEEVLKSYPNHVLSKPCCQGMVRKIIILSPHSELKRGDIYFLIPDSSLPSSKSSKESTKSKLLKNQQIVTSVVDANDDDTDKPALSVDDVSKTVHKNVVVCHNIDESKLNKSKSSGKHQRRRSSRGSKTGTWHPHLQSITEDF